MLLYVRKINSTQQEVLSFLSDTLSFLTNIEVNNDSILKVISENIDNNKIIIPILSTKFYDALTSSDLTITAYTTNLEQMKKDYLKQVLRIITNTYTDRSVVDLFYIISLTNKLLEEGLYLTKDNYTTFTSTTLSNKDIQFLKNNFGKIDYYQNVIISYNQFINSYDSATSVSELDTMFKTFKANAGII